jgi:GAF domain-containing protein
VLVRVEGRLWGVMVVGSRVESLPAGIEARLAGFTELAATAIANAQARVELRGFADEQAALRRVATLVAQAAPRSQVLAAVIEEAGRLLHAKYAMMARYGPDGTMKWSPTGAPPALPPSPSAARQRSAGRTWPHWCSAPAGRRGSTTTPAARARSLRPLASSASARRSACR